MNDELKAKLEELLQQYPLPEFMVALRAIATEMQFTYDPYLGIADTANLSQFCVAIAEAARCSRRVEESTAFVELPDNQHPVQ